MKTKKIWRIAFMMLAAFSLVSCSSGTADGGRCGTADRQHRGGDQCGHPTFGHRRQKPLANQLPHTEDTETSIGFYYSRNS